MKMKIDHRYGGETLYEGDHVTLRDAAEAAVACGASLARASLVGASLVGARLDGASLDGARLDGASLARAWLDGASLVGASLVGARLDGARLDGARLVGARLDGASLDGASLDGASLDGASLDGARLDGARLDGADLSRIRADFFAVLDSTPFEVPGLEIALEEGLVNGSSYTGECACLVGTIAKVRECEVQSIYGLKPDSDRLAERWFLAIKPDMPVTHPVVSITLGWIREWYAERAAQFSEAS